ncbi:MAG TPA: hypothetical protein VMR21_11545 [Vicinamibacteria bacterium]|nr:hypothetical protein [Vicinamibacteria bacterium]
MRVAGTPIPMVRCHLDGAEDDPARELRYVPAAEFELWRFFMQTKHQRTVTVEEVSVWVPEGPGIWDERLDADALAPVLRIRFEKPGPDGSVIPVERFFPAETYPQARAALLAHFDPRCRWSVVATPGYFVPAHSARLRCPAEAVVA